ncbi:MAG: 2-oxo acid dehydrogenase subunit E2 [Streptomycetaceae bacterium]|nr:2-oxo acid dehydrogenase subunit E2 [Streptomycetaceae bacterium]
MTAERFREFKMPDVGEGLTEAEILKWYVGPGDTVHDGMVVCEVETAKAAVELPIPFDGVVHEIRFPEGRTVDVGAAIITVDTQVGEAPEPAKPKTPQQSQPPQPPEPQQKRQAVLVGYGVSESSTKRRPRKPVAAVPAQAAEFNGRGGTPTLAAPPPIAPTQPRPLAKPPVRKLAKDLGVDLASVVPTGPHATVTREDVHAAAAPPQAQERVEQPTPAVPMAAAAERERRVPVKGVRKATAQAMVASAFTAPHVTEFVTFDITRTMRLVQQLKTDPAFEGLKVSPLLLVAKALLIAIRRNQEINASWDEERQEIVYKGYVNLGIAAATPRGLIVPNIKDAQAKTLPELASAIGELVAAAREGKTSPAAMQGGTVTITNVGVFGIDTGTPILNPGESAILAFGAVKEQPWVHKGKVKPRQVTTLALSFDHRLVDGELGSKVLADVAAILEHPKRLITWA